MIRLQLRERLSRLDLQAKVVLVLFLVICTTFLLVAFAVSQATLPVIEGEMRALGLHSSRELAEEIADRRLFQPGKENLLQNQVDRIFEIEPDVIRVDTFRGEGSNFTVAASTHEGEVAQPPGGRLPESPLSIREHQDHGHWVVWSPVRSKKGVSLGAVRMEVSLRSASGLIQAVWKVLSLAGLCSFLVLLVALGYFLRKTIQNDRRLKAAESQNVELSAQLREAEQELILKEKLAVMGQLTASFAHEIGTPLNAIGGHLQLLQDELESNPQAVKRLGIVSDQLLKIENIVKGFLHNTAKPVSQLQLTDLNQVMEKTLGIVSPRLDSLGVAITRRLDSSLSPVRAVPLDIEQVLLNVLNNSLDSLQSKKETDPRPSRLEVFSGQRRLGREEWLEVGVTDYGRGIPRADLERVFQPFYTTKPPGAGTGLGLSICRDIAEKYRGKLHIDSKEGAWTRVTFRMPYGVTQ